MIVSNPETFEMYQKLVKWLAPVTEWETPPVRFGRYQQSNHFFSARLKNNEYRQCDNDETRSVGFVDETVPVGSAGDTGLGTRLVTPGLGDRLVTPGLWVRLVTQGWGIGW